MGKVLQELGIDTSKMSAPEVQDKLIAIKNQLETSFKDTLKEIDNKIHEVASDYYKQINSYQLQVEKEEKTIKDFIDRIEVLKDKKYEHIDTRDNLMGFIDEIKSTIDSLPAVVALRKQETKTAEKFNEYVKILDREVKRLTSEYVRMDLVNSLKSMKQIENKVSK